MDFKIKGWARQIASGAVSHPWWNLLGVGVVTVVMMLLAGQLEMRTNWTELLPPDNPTVHSYREVQERFGEQSLVIALEGDRAVMIEMASKLIPALEHVEGLYNVQSRFPEEFVRDHGFIMMKPELFNRSLRMFENRSLVGTFRGFNNDYELEYTDSESNLKRDEVEIARNMLGLTRSLEILHSNFAGRKDAPKVEEAVDAMTLGEPWMLSSDRRMLLITCTPKPSMLHDVYGVMDVVIEVEGIVDRVSAIYPEVEANLTGMAKIQLDEMDTIGIYMQILAIAALILIYLLLARSFRSWLIPVFALFPLLVGITWTMGVLYLLFGGLNLFTSMMMIILIGLGIDFSVHLIARFREEISIGSDLETSLAIMFSETGTAVITGALTTALAFLTLMIAETKGVFEFGAASGLGILLTLIAIFFALPSMLVIQRRKHGRSSGRRERKSRDKGKSLSVPMSAATDKQAYDWIGSVARTSWNRAGVFLVIAGLLLTACYWATKHIEYEYDFLELEAKGLKSVELQREIPKRFGMADHSAWLITDSIEQSRQLKEQLRKKGLVGEVISISDYIPSEERLREYTPALEQFRCDILRQDIPGWDTGDSERLAEELSRLWDNLDLMSNVAYTAGLDRIVRVIDQLTGYDSETNTTDTTAVLPALEMMFRRGVDKYRAEQIAETWSERLTTNLYSMSDPEPVSLDDLPPVVRKTHLPRQGEGYLLMVFPRKNLWEREALVRFAEQTTSVHAGISGTEQLTILMMDKTLEEGGRASLLALAVIAILVVIHFRHISGLLALIPLAVGSLTMLGFMYVLGMKHNYMTLITVPIILGIGIDDGVHALHRFRRSKGIGAVKIFNSYRFVGRAILLSSLTTMIGFGSVALHQMRGMASFGQVLFLGVGSCFIATVLFLPAVLRIFFGGKSAKSDKSQEDETVRVASSG